MLRATSRFVCGSRLMIKQVSEKHSVEVVPTVLLFERGIVTKRLDGVPGVGLNEKQLRDLTDAH